VLQTYAVSCSLLFDEEVKMEILAPAKVKPSIRNQSAARSYSVQVVCDGCGSVNPIAEEMA
jgi:hypothetical protein